MPNDNLFVDLAKDVKSVAVEASNTYKNIASFGQLDSNFNKLTKSSNKFTASLGSITKITTNVTALGLGLLSVASNLTTLTTLSVKAVKSFKEFNNISQGLTFADAISGSNKLRENIKNLKNTGNVLYRLILFSDSLFNTDKIQKWSSKYVSAYAAVEQSAYRLSTITVSGNQRSIDSLQKNISLMRELQKATDYAVDSVGLLNTQYDIASAGFTSNQELSQVGRSSINLSQAGFGDVGGSTNAIVRVLRALGEESNQAETRASQLFETTKVGLLTLDQLTSEIGTLAVNAKQLGIDFEEVAAALAGMTTRGISTAEASTQLEALFAEITLGSEEANKKLANFRDNAGKPIQLNLTALREKGLKGLIDDLNFASQGSASFIQDIFSTKEAQKATKVLLSLGDDFEEFTTRIKNADPANLESEARNRSKTLSGAYNKAFNESQKNAEDLGSGLSISALDSLISVNREVSFLANAGAEATGKTIGYLTTIAVKAKAVGGFLGTLFITLFPLAIFNTAISNINKLKSSFVKEGETIKQAIQRNFREAIQYTKRKFDGLLTYIVSKVKQINSTPIVLDVKTDNKTQKALSGSTTTSSSLAIYNQDNSKLSAPNKRRNLNRDSSFDVIDVAYTVIDSLPDKVNSNLDKTKEKTKGIFNTIKKSATSSVGFLASSFKTVGAMAVNLGVTGAALGAGIAYLGTSFNNLSKIVNKKTIPELQKLRETIQDLSDIEGIQDIVDSLDLSRGLSSTNDELSITEDILNRMSGIWNTITFSTLQYKTINEELITVQSKLQKEIKANDEAIKAGELRSKSPEAKAAESKLKANISLDSTDKSAIELENKKKIQIIDTNIALQKQRIAAFESKGNKDENTLNSLRRQLDILEKQSKEQKKQIGLQLTKLELQNGLNALNSVNTVIPLQIQLNSNRESALKAQIDDVVDTFNGSFSNVVNDKSAERFKNVKSKLSATLKGIEAQVNIDPQTSLKLKKDLEDKLGINITKLFIANPELKELSAKVNEAISKGIENSRGLKDTANTSLISSIESVGIESTLLSTIKYKELLKSIDVQLQTLNAELVKPETSLIRQQEILATIATLDGKRLNLQIENITQKELTGKKKVLETSKELLNLEQTKLNILNSENQFNISSINTAQTKLNIAEKELQVKKENLNIANREEIIKREQSINALKPNKIKLKTNNIKLKNTNNQKQENSIKTEIEKLKNNSDNKLNILSKETENKLAQTEANRFSFKDGENGSLERNTIAEAIKQIIIFSGNGTKVNKDLGTNISIIDSEAEVDRKIKSTLFKDGVLQNSTKVRQTLLQNVNSKGAAKASNILEEKNLQASLEKQRIRLNQKDAVSQEEKNLTNSIKELNNNFEKQLSREQSKLISNNIISRASTNRNNSIQQDLINTKIDNQLKLITDTFDSAIKISTARIELESAAREKTIRQGEAISDTFSQISSNSEIFGNSIASASLSLADINNNNKSQRAIFNQDKAIKEINTGQSIREQLVVELSSALQEAIRLGASSDKIKEIQDSRDRAIKNRDIGKEESKIDINNIKQQTALILLNNELEKSAAIIKLESAGRELIVNNLTKLGNSFSNFASGLSNAVSNILPNSSTSAKLNTKAITVEEEAAILNRKNEAEKQSKLLESRLNAIDKLIESAILNDADSSVVSSLKKSKEDIITEINTKKANLAQVNALDNATSRLNIFASKLNESNQIIDEVINISTEQVNNSKALLDLQQREKNINSEVNKSNTNLQTSILGIFGKNSPFVSILEQRLQVQETKDNARLEKSQNITEAKKEILDVTLQKAQLNLEQQVYENALTQTALLSDLISVSEGKEARFSSTDIIKESIEGINNNIATSRNINQEKINILDRKIAFIPNELSKKNQVIDRNALASQANILGSELNPANFDLQRDLISESSKSLRSFKRSEINVGSLNDNDFLKNINRINSLNGLTSNENIKSNSYGNKGVSQSSPSSTINAPITVSVSVSGNEVKKDNLELQISQVVGKQVNQRLESLSRQLLNNIDR